MAFLYDASRPEGDRWYEIDERDSIQPSATSGDQDHSDPWKYAGANADPPVNSDG